MPSKYFLNCHTKDWVDVLLLLAYNYYTSIQKTTIKLPFEIHFQGGQIRPAPDASVIPPVFPTADQIHAERVAIPHFDPFDEFGDVLNAQDIQRLENLSV